MNNRSPCFTSFEEVVSALQPLFLESVDTDKLRKIRTAVVVGQMEGTLKIEKSQFQEILQGIDKELAKIKEADFAASSLEAKLTYQCHVTAKLQADADKLKAALIQADTAIAASRAREEELEAAIRAETVSTQKAEAEKLAAEEAELERQLAAKRAERDAFQQKLQQILK